MANLKVKKGDTVVVITGKDKGKKGKIQEVSPKTNKILVEGVNIVKRHTKPKGQTSPGGIIKQEGMINASNAMVVCPKCSKATRVAHQIDNGEKTRVCKKCGAQL